MNALIGLSLALHGLVHLLYFGQSARFFEMKPGMLWPTESWAFAKLLGERWTRTLAGVLCVVATAGFLLGAVGLLLSQAWMAPLILASAAVSLLLFLLFWDGRLHQLDNQGGVGALLDFAILATVLLRR